MTEEQTINVAIGEDVINVNLESADAINVTLEGGIAQITYVEENVKFSFNGLNGDTYLLFNSATGKLELWIKGVKKQQWG